MLYVCMCVIQMSTNTMIATGRVTYTVSVEVPVLYFILYSGVFAKYCRAKVVLVKPESLSTSAGCFGLKSIGRGQPGFPIGGGSGER